MKSYHRVGMYNVEYGHPVNEHARMIMKRFEDKQLDVLGLTEVADYVHALQKLAEDAGHRLLYVDGPENVKSQAILVRSGVKIGKVHSVPMAATYFATNGDVRRSCCPLVADLDDNIYAAVHAPVGAWTAGRGGRHFLGPIRRRIAFIRYVNRLVRIFKNHPGKPVRLLGDWNVTPDASGPNSAQSLCKRTGAHIIRPHASTGHGEIDFEVARDTSGELHVQPNEPKLPRSDHFLVTGVNHTTKH